MGKVTVPKGLLVVPKEDGSGYIPFLINVREEDIIWGKKNAPIENVMGKFLSESRGEMYSINPGTYYRMEKDGWTCEIHSDGSTIATKKIAIDDMFAFSDETHNCLRSRDISLPLLFLYDQEFNIQVTKCSYNDQLSCSTVNAPLNGTTSWTCVGTDGVSRTYSGYKAMIAEIHSPVYRFPDTFIKDMKGSYLFIMIRGFIPVI